MKIFPLCRCQCSGRTDVMVRNVPLVIWVSRPPRWCDAPRTMSIICSASCAPCAPVPSTPATSSTWWRIASSSASATMRRPRRRVNDLPQSLPHLSLSLLVMILLCHRSLFGWLPGRRSAQQAAPHHNHGQATGDTEDRLQQQSETRPTCARAAVAGHGPGHAGSASVVPEQVCIEYTERSFCIPYLYPSSLADAPRKSDWKRMQDARAGASTSARWRATARPALTNSSIRMTSRWTMTVSVITVSSEVQ